jgi:hypothetical protein
MQSNYTTKSNALIMHSSTRALHCIMHHTFCSTPMCSPLPPLKASTEPEAAQIADVAGLQLALATGFSIYSLKDTKKMELGGWHQQLCT